MNREELISAYLDDELPRDEREEIERLLATDAGARRLCNELRAQRDALGKLPRLTLNEDLTDAILRAAERRILLDSNVSPPASETDWLRRARRPVAWGALVLAVGLLIMLLSPERAPQEVALAPPPSAELAAARVDESKLAEARSGLAAKTEEADRPEASRDLGQGEVGELGVPQSPPGESAGRMAEPMFGKGGAHAPGGGGFNRGAGQVADSVREQSLPRSKGGAVLNAPAPAQSLQFDAREPEGPPSGTVVICDISPEAAAQNLFAQVLANHDVVLETPEAQGDVAADEAAVGGGVQNAPAAEPGVQATDTVVIEATRDQMLGILDELSQQPQQFGVVVAPPPDAQGNAASQAPVPAKDYLNQLPDVNGYRARNQLRQNQQAFRNQGNARVMNRFTQAPGGPLNVERPEAGLKKEQLQAAAKARRAEPASGVELQQAPSEPLESYYVILRQAPAGLSQGQQNAPPSEPAESPQPPR